MKDVFNKPCLSQASTRNSTMKLSQPLRRTNNGQHCISFLAPSVWNNLPNELKRCTNLNTFKHKVKECFLYKIREKDNDVLRSLRLDSWLHNNWCIFSLILIFFFFLTFYPILVYQFFKDHNGNKASWMLFLCYTSHKLILGFICGEYIYIYIYIYILINSFSCLMHT